MRILFLGDVVAKSGRKKVEERLPGLIKETKSDFVIVMVKILPMVKVYQLKFITVLKMLVRI